MGYEISAEDINKKIVDLWKRKWPDGSVVKVPLLFEGFHEGGLLTIGMNPSYSKKMPELIKKYGKGLSEDDFKWADNNQKNEKVISYDEWSKNNKGYKTFFGRFWEIRDKLELKWNHIDLFFYRETEQENFLKDLKDKKFGEDFEKDSLGIVKEIIEKINPDIILVANKKACDVFKKVFKKGFEDEFKSVFGPSKKYPAGIKGGLARHEKGVLNLGGKKSNVFLLYVMLSGRNGIKDDGLELLKDDLSSEKAKTLL